MMGVSFIRESFIRDARHELLMATHAVVRRRHARQLRWLRRRGSDAVYSLRPFEQTRSIFVHVPKASGVSVNMALYGGMGAGHMRISEYELAFSASEFYSYFKFTFVRNPWDRLFSAYQFLKSGGMLDVDRAWAQERLARYGHFRQFVLEGLRLKETLSHVHFAPQHGFLLSLDRRRYPIDFVGLFENLPEDFAAIAKRLGRSAGLEHLNRTPGALRDYRDAYDGAMIDEVAAVYRKDIALFGYDFDGAKLGNQISLRDAGRLLRR